MRLVSGVLIDDDALVDLYTEDGFEKILASEDFEWIGRQLGTFYACDRGTWNLHTLRMINPDAFEELVNAKGFRVAVCPHTQRGILPVAMYYRVHAKNVETNPSSATRTLQRGERTVVLTDVSHDRAFAPDKTLIREYQGQTLKSQYTCDLDIDAVSADFENHLRWQIAQIPEDFILKRAGGITSARRKVRAGGGAQPGAGRKVQSITCECGWTGGRWEFRRTHRCEFVRGMKDAEAALGA